MPKNKKPTLAHPVNNLEKRRVIYSKLLFNQGKKYLENNTVESYFNIALILFANAIEIMVQTLSFCLTGKDRYKDSITTIIDDLKKLDELKDFPYSELTKIVNARNSVYHRAIFHTWPTCDEMRSTTERSLSFISSNYLDVNFEDISLSLLIKNDETRNLMTKAEQFLNKGNFTDTIINSCHAFAIFERRIKGRGKKYSERVISSNNFSTKISYQYLSKKYIDLKLPNLTPITSHIEEQVNKKLTNLAEHFDFALILGTSYEDFKYFNSIKPLYHVTLSGFQCPREKVERENYQREDAEFIFNFVLKIVLDLEPKLRPVKLRALDGKVYSEIQ